MDDLPDDPDELRHRAHTISAAGDEPSGQGIALGMDTYCLVREPQLGTTYGGMTACRLQDRQLRLAFTAEAAEELCVEAIVEIDLHLDEDGLAILQRGLRQVLLSGRPDQHPALTGV